MSQLFHRSANTISRVTIFGAAFMAVGAVVLLGVIFRSPYETGVGEPVEQPIQFSHKHHVGDEGIDCRFCHTTAEYTAYAGFPTTEICMKCHSVLFADSPALALVRESWQTGQPIVWRRVNELPDFTYFDHSIHVNKGVGCETCHGRVDLMPILWKAETFHMEWCLECHRNPERFVRPREFVFAMGFVPDEPQAVLGPRLVDEYAIEYLTSCSICHR